MKKWYYSKTVWVNLIAAVAVLLQSITGTEVINVEAQMGIVVVLNLILRIVTKQGLEL